MTLALVFLFSTESQAIKIAAFGDSITRGWPYYKDDANGIANSGGYIPGLQSRLNANDWGSGSSVTVYNWGHPGEKVYFDGRDRFISPSAILDSNSDYVLVMEGTNDLAIGIGPGSISDKLNAIIEDVLAAEQIPVIGTLLPRYDGDASNTSIETVNDNIHVIAQNHDIEIAELYSASANWNALMTDGLHPNTSGYNLMADVWFNTLATEKAKREAAERARIAGAVSATNFLLLLND